MRKLLRNLTVILFVVFIVTIASFAINNAVQISVYYNTVKNIIINGKQTQFQDDTKPFVYNGRTYVPLRFISETLGNTVEWDENSGNIHINSPDYINLKNTDYSTTRITTDNREIIDCSNIINTDNPFYSEIIKNKDRLDELIKQYRLVTKNDDLSQSNINISDNFFNDSNIIIVLHFTYPSNLNNINAWKSKGIFYVEETRDLSRAIEASHILGGYLIKIKQSLIQDVSKAVYQEKYINSEEMN